MVKITQRSILAVAIVAILLQVADGVLTYVGITYYRAQEGNPMIAQEIEASHGLMPLLRWKAAAIALVTVVMLIGLKVRRPSQVKSEDALSDPTELKKAKNLLIRLPWVCFGFLCLVVVAYLVGPIRLWVQFFVERQ